MEPGLSHDHDAVTIGFAHFVDRIADSGKFFGDDRIFRMFFDAVGFCVTEDNGIHQRMRNKERNKNAAERTQTN
jgi:hypothetical protein